MLFFTYNPEFLGIFHYTILNSTLKLRFTRKCFKTSISFKYLDNLRVKSFKHMNEENLNGLGLKIHFNFVYVKTETGYSDTFTQGCRVKLAPFR